MRGLIQALARHGGEPGAYIALGLVALGLLSFYYLGWAAIHKVWQYLRSDGEGPSDDEWLFAAVGLALIIHGVWFASRIPNSSNLVADFFIGVLVAAGGVLGLFVFAVMGILIIGFCQIGLDKLKEIIER